MPACPSSLGAARDRYRSQSERRLVSARYCYANYNSFVNDGDQDWLDDQCECELARAFSPVLVMSPGDGCGRGEPYWAAKYFPNEPAFGWGDFVRIAYMPAYYKDCGSYGHPSDSEFIMVGIHYNPSTQHWEVRDNFLHTPPTSAGIVSSQGLSHSPHHRPQTFSTTL